MQKKFAVKVESEIGKLEGVVLHNPGPEIENMTPANAERALYSDILNRKVAAKGYRQFSGVLKKLTRVFFIQDLLTDILENPEIKSALLHQICETENASYLTDRLSSLPAPTLAKQLIEGVALERDNLSRFLSSERYSLRPLHNFFFTRDAAVAFSSEILIGRMAKKVRHREAMIAHAILSGHPFFSVPALFPAADSATIEGGDVLVARKDLLLIGSGSRTNTRGIDSVIELLKKQKKYCQIIVQQLPDKPESFIHLDMVFTFLDRHQCMVYEPIVCRPNPFRTVLITVDSGKVKIQEEDNLLRALENCGMGLDPVFCGGTRDPWIQQREQWHSGANFFAVAPGQVLGYDRNVNTLAELSDRGYAIIKAKDVLKDRVDPACEKRFVITIEGSELSRGGGGCRCMTMPLRRQDI